MSYAVIRKRLDGTVVVKRDIVSDEEFSSIPAAVAAMEKLGYRNLTPLNICRNEGCVMEFPHKARHPFHITCINCMRFAAIDDITGGVIVEGFSESQVMQKVTKFQEESK